MLQFSGFYFGFFFFLLRKNYGSPVLNKFATGRKWGERGSHGRETNGVYFILSAVEGFRVPVGPLVLLTVYAITRF